MRQPRKDEVFTEEDDFFRVPWTTTVSLRLWTQDIFWSLRYKSALHPVQQTETGDSNDFIGGKPVWRLQSVVSLWKTVWVGKFTSSTYSFYAKASILVSSHFGSYRHSCVVSHPRSFNNQRKRKLQHWSANFCRESDGRQHCTQRYHLDPRLHPRKRLVLDDCLFAIWGYGCFLNYL